MPPAEPALALEDPPTSFKHMSHQEVLEDLSSRFILNLPESELQSIERICFQVEQAHWYYEDFVREENRALPSLPLKKFSAMLFRSCPILKQWSHDHEVAFDNFMQYKTRVPVCGAIMLNDALDKCILVKGWKSSSGWGFPKGKINENEAHATCAAREVLEETGYDLTEKIVEADHIQLTIREQVVTLFIVCGVPEDAVFVTRTRKEISKIEWFKLTDLPTWKRNRTSTSKFYLISPFIGPLKEYLHQRKQLLNGSTSKSKRKQRQHLEQSAASTSASASAEASVIDNLFARISSTPAPQDDSDATTSCSSSSSPTTSTLTRRAPADPHLDRLMNSLASSADLPDLAVSGSSAPSSSRASTPASPSQTPQAPPDGRLHPSASTTPSLSSHSRSNASSTSSASQSPIQDAQDLTRKRRQLALLEAVSEEIAQAQAQATPQPPHALLRPATTSPVRPLHPHAFMQAPPPYASHIPHPHPLPAHQLGQPFQVQQQPQFQQLGPVLANGPARIGPPSVLNGAGPLMPNGMPALNGVQVGPPGLANLYRPPVRSSYQGAGPLPSALNGGLPSALSGALPPGLSGGLPSGLNGGLPGVLNGNLHGGLNGSLSVGPNGSLSGGPNPNLLPGLNGGTLPPPPPSNFGSVMPPSTHSGPLPSFPASINIPPTAMHMNGFPISPVSANGFGPFPQAGGQPIVNGFSGVNGRPQLAPLQPLAFNRVAQYGAVPLSAGPTFATHQQPVQQTQQQQHLLSLLNQRPPPPPLMQLQPARPSTAAANPNVQALLDILNHGPRL